MADFEPVFTIEGPPSIRVEQAEVTRDDRVWVQNRIVVQDGRPGVVVVPVDDDGQVALIRILRPVLGREMLELPRGFGETRPAEDARRELLEETGMRALELRPLGTFVVDSGLMPTVVAAYEARVDRAAPAGQTDGEANQVVWITPEELGRMVDEGTIADAITLATVLRWSRRRASS